MAWFAVGNIRIREQQHSFRVVLVASASYRSALSAAMAYPERRIIEARDSDHALAIAAPLLQR